MSSSKRSQMAKPRSGSATRRRRAPTPEPEPERFRLAKRLAPLLTGPAGRQLVAVALILFGLLTLTTVAGLNSGALTSVWARLLVFLCGWGAYPTAALITGLGLLWLRDQVHVPTSWRWRPFIGLELTLIGLLGLTHTLLRNQGWQVVESGRGGGLIGWALSIFFSTYFGPLITDVLLGTVALIGVGLACDLTGADFRALGLRIATAWETHRVARAAQSRAEEVGAVSLPTTPAAEEPESPPATRKPPRRRKSTATPPPPRSDTLPPFTLLQPGQTLGMSHDEIERKSRIIEETLAQFGIPVQVTEQRPGPTVTQFGVTPGYIKRGPDGEEQRKVRVRQIAILKDDLALALAARSLRIEAPVPGRAVVGIEVPNANSAQVTLRHVLETKEYQKCAQPLCFAVGLDVAGSAVVADLAAMPHLLIAGTTGSGKSVFIKTLAAGLLMRNRPDELKMVAIDPKIVELSHLNGLPHLLGRAETDLDRILRVLRWVAMEMDNRYKLLAQVTARNLDDYNRKAARKGEPTLPRIVVLIDELADLMMVAPEDTERTLTRIAQMARATGVHLVVATQRPSTDVVTGVIKANFPARISFATASQVDSRVILDTPGAESLLGRGDMLFLAPDASAPRRIQGCYLSDKELEALIRFWQERAGATPAQAPWETMAKRHGPAQLRIEGETEDAGYLERAIALARSRGQISTSAIQRRLRISYPRAARLMEEMEDMGIVGPQESAGRSRRVFPEGGAGGA